MSKKEYKLSKTLYGHSLDVRSVTVTSKNDIISGSRDKTCKFWRYNALQDNYEEVMTYNDQKNFVGAVLYIEPTEEYPDGLVVTGGNDHVILIYKPSEPFATFRIKQHSDTVSCLSEGNEKNTFFSGSWDNSAKYHKLVGSPVCLVTFSGHSAAIWSVIQLKDDQIVTASADRTIIMWNNKGEKLQTLTGHTDCVRALVDISGLNVFASAANDATIKIWKYTGDNIQTLYGHTNYIYSVANCKSVGLDCLVSSDEDRTVRIWENGINIQNISLPAQSVWSVDCLSNGDIVTGSSDGVIRIFTRDQTRVANEQALTKFSEEVSNLKHQSMQEIGGVKVSDLPGKEALFDPGKRAGQMKMIREEGKVVAYTWIMDGDASHWEKVGDVMGGTDKDSCGKTVYEGKAYDFVFNVDVEDGKPPLKLPYNKGDDVYQAAHAFLSKNLLPAEYLEQVVDFILKNSQEQFVPSSNEYQDPFTGGSRYTPSYQSSTRQMGMNVDPFTGGSSYSTSSSKTVMNSTPTSGNNADPFTGGFSYTTTSQMAAAATFFPISSYKTFDTSDLNIVLNKLKEFNWRTSMNEVSETELVAVMQLCAGPPSIGTVFDIVFRLLDWPDDLVFPVLDIIRLAVRHAVNNKVIVEVNNGVIMTKLLHYINQNHQVVNNTIVAFRILSNLCLHEAGENIIFNNRFHLLETIISLGVLNKNAQIALATMLLNMTILLLKRHDDTGFLILAEVMPEVGTKLTDPEAQFRIYVALGTLLKQCNSQKGELLEKIVENTEFLAIMDLHSKYVGNVLENKRADCVKQLQALFGGW